MYDIKKGMFVGEDLNKEETIGNKKQYTILSQFGQGMFSVYKIIPGMYIFFHDIELKNIVENKVSSRLSSPVLKIEYCLGGACTRNCPYKNVCITSKGSTAYYIGTEKFEQVDFSGNQYQSISIFCYLNEVGDSMEQLFGVLRQKIEAYYEKLSCRKNFLVVETNAKSAHMVNEIYQYIESNNIELIKIRTIELFLSEINNYDAYINRDEKYYKKSTIDKMEFVRVYIEENMQEHVTIDRLSYKFNIGSTELKQCFKHVNGVGVYSYLKKYRMKIASELLISSDYNILAITNMIGYSNQSKFSASFKKAFGMTPLKYRKMQ